ncbi:nucleoside deaminase [Arcanobacterium hippocoleae]
MREYEIKLMQQAMELAKIAGAAGDVPVGALICDKTGKIIGRGFNTREAFGDPVGHAEVNAMREAAAALGTWNLTGCTLAVTLEPCTMCAGAIINSRISRVIFGTWDEKAGAAGSVRDVLRDARLPHQAEVIGGFWKKKRLRSCVNGLSKISADRTE